MTLKKIAGSRLNLLLDKRFFQRGREYTTEEVKKAVGLDIDDLILGWSGHPFNRWTPTLKEWYEGVPLSIDRIWVKAPNKAKDESETAL